MDLRQLGSRVGERAGSRGTPGNPMHVKSSDGGKAGDGAPEKSAATSLRLALPIMPQGRFLHQRRMAAVSCPALLLSIPTLPPLDLRVCHTTSLGVHLSLSTVGAVVGFKLHSRDGWWP